MIIKESWERYLGLAVVGITSVFCLSACSSTTTTSHAAVQEVVVTRDSTRNVPGVVEYIWEEPMVDVVEVPPGLDPEGHYYRPAHQEIVEIRQGRWRYYRDK